MEIKKDYLELSKKIIETALYEDLQSGDVTTEVIISSSLECSAKIIAKEDGIVCGLDVAKFVFEFLEKRDIIWNQFRNDGDYVRNGEVIAELSASYTSILSGERTALNFLQRMSGVASKTNLFVKTLTGTNTKLLDTRKTLPGFRYLDKYSVLMGGGTNHRFGLFDMVMIKENHIKVAGSITKAVEVIRKKYNDKYKIEVETTNLDEVKEAITANADIIMLDNMSIEQMKECNNFINGRAKTEASGNVDINNIREIALTGVDFISVGAITHSVNALDISLLIT